MGIKIVPAIKKSLRLKYMLRGIYGVKLERWIAELRIKGFARIIEKQKKKKKKREKNKKEKKIVPTERNFLDFENSRIIKLR